jgi:hypothetical protein
MLQPLLAQPRKAGMKEHCTAAGGERSAVPGADGVPVEVSAELLRPVDKGVSGAAATKAVGAAPATIDALSLTVSCLRTFAVLLDATIVNVALLTLMTDLRASLDQVVWVINDYLLVFASLLILASRLGDMLGPLRLFVIGLSLFAAASALCGAA